MLESGFLRIYFPQVGGPVMFKTLPIRREMTARDACKYIQSKFDMPGMADCALFEVGG